MSLTNVSFLALVGLCIMIHPSSSETSPLTGKVLRVYVSELPPYMIIKRNMTGHITGISGTCVETLNWLSKSLGFTYQIVNLPVMNTFDQTANESGTVNYIINGDVDWIVGAIIMTESRNKVASLPYPWAIHFASALLPFPEKRANLSAPLEPFNYLVWTLLLLAVITVPAAMWLLNYLFDVTINVDPIDNRAHQTFARLTDYVVSVLLSQGAPCYSRRLFVRLIAASWCLACLVLIYAYSSTLTSFLSAPNRQILVNSIYQVPEKSYIKLVVTKGKAADIIISHENTDRNIYKYFKDMLDKQPSLRCPTVNKCLDKVRAGSFVYVDVYAVLMYLISNDLKQTGHCRYTVTKERFTFTPATFVIPRYNEYTESVNKGIIRMWDTGLIDAWERRMIPKPVSCLNIKQQPPRNPQLSLKNLSGPFILFLIGFICSLFMFVAERLLKFPSSDF